MCGRYALHALDAEDIHLAYPFIPPPSQFIDEPHFHGRYNIAPRSHSPILRQDENASDNLVLQTMRWGIVPHYAKVDEAVLKTINARGEAVVDGTSGLWNGLRGKKRCVIPAEGYYEWLKKSNHERVPHFTKRTDGKLMLMAGMWDKTVLEGKTEPLYTFTIITTSATQSLAFLHDRMPVVLSTEEEITAWLSPATEWSQKLAQIVKPAEITFDCYPVPKEVGKVGTDDPSFVLPVSQRKDGIEAMFKKQQSKNVKAVVSASESLSRKSRSGTSESLESPTTAKPSSQLNSPSSPPSRNEQPQGLTSSSDSSSRKRRLEEEEDDEISGDDDEIREIPPPSQTVPSTSTNDTDPENLDGGDEPDDVVEITKPRTWKESEKAKVHTTTPPLSPSPKKKKVKPKNEDGDSTSSSKITSFFTANSA